MEQIITGDDILDGAPIGPVMPDNWTAEWVCERMVQAFETLRKIGGRIGPKEFGTAWAEYALDYKEVRLRGRAEEGEVEKMEQAISWPARYLSGESIERRLQRDAVGFFAYHKACGHEMLPLLRARKIAALRRATEAANAEHRRQQEARAEIAADGQRWYAEQLSRREKNWAPSERAEKLAALDHQRWQREDRELKKLPPIKIRAVDGANGLCIGPRTLLTRRMEGYEIISAALHLEQVPVR